MALNIKPFFPFEHPIKTTLEFDEGKIGFMNEDSAIDLDKEFRENSPKEHNLEIEKFLLKINVIS